MLINPERLDDPRPGKHRGITRRHRPAHRGDYASFLARMVPAWTIRSSVDRPPRGQDRQHLPGATPAAPAVHREEEPSIDATSIDIDLRTARKPFDIDALESGLLAPQGPRTDLIPQIVVAELETSDPEPIPVSHPAALEPDGAPDALPVWDPTGKHTTATTPVPDLRSRRLSFADLLGFGIDMDETVSTHEHDVIVESAPEEVPTPIPTWNDMPTLSDVVTAENASTNELVQRLWDATAEHPVAVPEDQLAPFDIQAMFRSNRTFRWSVVAGALAVLVVGILTMRAIGQRPVAIAEQRAVAYETNADRLTSALTGFDATARTITNPATTADDLSLLTGELLSVGTIAHDLAEVATEPLPEPSLLGASAPIDRLASPQDLLQQASERALTVERRLGATLSYRVLMTQAFVTPELPVAAREGDIGELGAELSVIETTADQVLGQLPDDAFFASYTASANDLLDEFRKWQVDYLSKLRDGDVAGAGVLRRDWQASVSAFRAEIAMPLMAVDTWSSEQLRQLREQLALATERLS